MKTEIILREKHVENPQKTKVIILYNNNFYYYRVHSEAYQTSDLLSAGRR